MSGNPLNVPEWLCWSLCCLIMFDCQLAGIDQWHWMAPSPLSPRPDSVAAVSEGRLGSAEPHEHHQKTYATILSCTLNPSKSTIQIGGKHSRCSWVEALAATSQKVEDNIPTVLSKWQMLAQDKPFGKNNFTMEQFPVKGWSVHFWVKAEGYFNLVPPVHVQID